MKMTIESTTKIVEVNGVPARIWQGVSERGIPVVAYITSIAAAADQDAWPGRVHIDHDSGDQIRAAREALRP